MSLAVGAFDASTFAVRELGGDTGTGTALGGGGLDFASATRGEFGFSVTLDAGLTDVLATLADLLEVLSALDLATDFSAVALEDPDLAAFDFSLLVEDLTTAFGFSVDFLRVELDAVDFLGTSCLAVAVFVLAEALATGGR